MPFDSETAPAAVSILVVDDKPANLLALGAVLKPLGVRVVEAQSGPEALARIDEESFAVMLLDVQLPDMDGFEVAARVRKTPNGRELPILFLTAIHRDELYQRRGYKAGAADYITKPFDADVLRARVKAFADLWKQREGVRLQQVALRTRERDEAMRKVAAFERIATAALETTDIALFLRQLIDVFLSAADEADSAMILLREGDTLHAKAAAALDGDAGLVTFSTKIGEGFAGKVAATRATLELANLASASAPQFDNAWLHARGAKVVLGVPLLGDNDVFGVALIGSRRAEKFSWADKRLLTATTERAAWAVAKHVQRSRLYEMLDSVPALIAVVSGPELRCEFINDGYRALFGPRDIVGLPMRQIGFNEEAAALIERVAKSGETVSIHELPISTDWRGDGERKLRYFNVTAQAMRNALGSVDRVMTFAVDVTPQVLARRAMEEHQAERAMLLERERKARAEAEIANRAKDDFLATVSHELRTPLNAIVGWTAAAKAKAPPELQRALGIVERNAKAQARIIEDVLDISRIISGKLRLEVRDLEADEPIRAAVEAVRPAADAKGVELAIELNEPGHVSGDAERLQQVVWNLLSNAIKFTPKGGRVVLTATRADGVLSVHVRDSGEGIAPDFLPDIFEPFRQADGSSTRRHGGLGLGLAIDRQIVQAHGGTVRAESDGHGHGSRFTVELPASPPAGPSARPESSETRIVAAQVTLDRLRVLVLDDEEDARALLEDVFTSRGALVALAASVDQALAVLAEFRPDVLVSDIAMPDRDGYSFIRSVRALPSECGGRTPAIALTAHARPEDTRRAFAAGFQRHMCKPVDVDHLVTTVANLGGLSLPDVRPQ
jgi:signal transduction histidine kinase/DNA-binding response OmpR family regulator